MRYEVVEATGEATGAWIVLRAGLEVARFGGQSEALQEVARRLREADRKGPAKLSLRFRSRA